MVENKKKTMINISIIHYNTPLLTECLIKSINKFTPDSKIYIFDNSDKYPFIYRQDNIVYFDNTKGQIIDFEKWLKNYQYKDGKISSAKHCYSIQKIMDIINEPFILLDSDVLLKKDISDLFNKDYGFIGEISSQFKRVYPFICFLNPQVLKGKDIKYFDEKHMLGLDKEHYIRFMEDTGCSLFLNKEKIPYKTIRTNDYVIHYGGGSYRGNEVSKEKWLINNFKYFGDDKIIVSITSYKKRLLHLKDVINSILKQTKKPYKICLTLYKEDIRYMDADLQNFLEENKIEIIITDEDLGPNKKWYYVMKKYKNNPIITIDDDIIYNNDLLKTLYDSYLKFPFSISARRVHKIKYDKEGNPIEYAKWLYEYKSEAFQPSFDLFATGVGGVLYPPNILNVDTIDINEIKKCLFADDIFLKKRENDLMKKVVWVKNNNLYSGKEIKEFKGNGLALVNNLKNRNDEYIKKIGLKQIEEEKNIVKTSKERNKKINRTANKVINKVTNKPLHTGKRKQITFMNTSW